MTPPTDESVPGPHDQIEWEILLRYLDATASDGERRTVDAYLAAHPAVRVALERFVRGGVERLDVVESDVQRAWQTFVARCGLESEAQLKNPPSSQLADRAVSPSATVSPTSTTRGQSRAPLGLSVFRISSRETLGWRRITSYGAVLGVTLAILMAVVVGAPFIPPFIDHTSTVPMRYATGNGQRATITLSDGTTIVLNVASRLEIPADYARGNHTVRLTGAALFTTTHHAGAPFTVLAGSGTVRVLGTSFLVRHYATDTSTTVAVRDGKVSVGTTVLGAAQQTVLSARGTLRVRQADLAQFSFAAGVLALRKVPLRDAIPELNRWYDADIRLGDPRLATRLVTGEWAAGSLADLAQLLELTFNIRVVRDGRTLTLYPG